MQSPGSACYTCKEKIALEADMVLEMQFWKLLRAWEQPETEHGDTA